MPLASVDWAVAVLPLLDCGGGPGFPPPLPASVFQVSYVEPDRDHSLAVVLAACTSGAGTPPKGLFVFDGAVSHTNAHLVQTLVSSRLVRQFSSFTVSRAPDAPASPVGATLTTSESAYSSDEPGGCCPDRHYTVTWTWANGSYRGSPALYASPLPPLQADVTTTTRSARVGDDVTYTVTVTNTSTADVTSVAVLTVPPYAPCLPPDCRTSQPALVWQRGSPACEGDSSQFPTCVVGSLRPGATAQVTIVLQVVVDLNPLAFSPAVRGTFPPGGFLAVTPEASITVLQ